MWNTIQNLLHPKIISPLADKQPTIGTKVSNYQAPKLTNEQLVGKYFPEVKRTAVAVFKQESQLGKFQQNLQGAPAYGIAQIYLPAHRAQIPGANDAQKIQWLKNPDNNLKFARQLYDKQGWQPWNAYTSGAYKKYL